MLVTPPSDSTADRFRAILLALVLATTALAALMTVIMAVTSISPSAPEVSAAPATLRDNHVMRDAYRAKPASTPAPATVSKAQLASVSTGAANSAVSAPPASAPVPAATSSTHQAPAPPAPGEASVSNAPVARSASISVDICAAGAAASAAVDRWASAGLPVQRTCDPGALKVDSTGKYYCVGGYHGCAAPPLAVCDGVAPCLHEIGHLIGLDHPALPAEQSCVGSASRGSAWTMAISYQNTTVMDGLNCAGQELGPWPADLSAAFAWLSANCDGAPYCHRTDTPAKDVTTAEAALHPDAVLPHPQT